MDISQSIVLCHQPFVADPVQHLKVSCCSLFFSCFSVSLHMIGVICYLQFYFGTASIVHFTSTVWTCTSIFGHHSGSDGSAYRNWNSWGKNISNNTKQSSKVAKDSII